ncbi:hypothetical protein FJZ33_11050 [Candidatus Poribacteria bacterium]|nr:hypothetical protein [Candidatus Poribacteria bacterium]
MFDHKSITLKRKSLISICLCMVFILNTGCQNSQQKAQSVQKDSIANSASQGEITKIEQKDSEPKNPPKQSKGISLSEESFWEFFTETANSVSYIPIAGASVAAICIDYESWRTLVEAF